MIYKIIILLIILLLVPQIYYLIQDLKYKSMAMTSKFFLRSQAQKERNLREVYLTNTDGFDLFVRIFDHENPKGIVQIVHGMSEHGGNYLDFARFLNKNGYVVAIADHRGHGKSIYTAYPNGYMKRAEELIDDQIMLAKYLKVIYPGLNHTLMGHSMGSMIARLVLRKNDDLFDKIILSGTVPPNSAAFVGNFFLNISCFYLGDKAESTITDILVGAGKGLGFISYNEENIRIKNTDPMRIFRFKLGYSRVLVELNKKLGQLSKYECKNPELEIYNMVGVDDVITKGQKGIDNSLAMLKNIGYTYINNKVYDNMKHEILNEKENYIVYEDILEILTN